MIKKIPFLLPICVVIFSCNTKQKPQASTNTLDSSINTSNSYNNLFLDSNTLNKCYATNNIDPEMAQAIDNFYYSRNFEYAWFSTDGLTEQARSLWNLLTYTKTETKDTTLYNKILRKYMADLIVNDSLVVQPNDPHIINTEILLTEYFINYLKKQYDNDSLNNATFTAYVPAKKQDLMHDVIYTINLNKSVKRNDPSQKAFYLLSDQLNKYYQIAQNKGWEQITFNGKVLKKGNILPVISSIKKRLSVIGYLPAQDTSALFDTVLENSIKVYQHSLGYTATGVINDSLIKDMNVDIEKRLEQILINMNRMKWMPIEDSGKLIMCNIPEYKIYVFENGKQVFNMPTVVGKDGHNTVIFTGNLNEIVFSPYWNIPASIVQKEMLPKMKENKKYLKENNIEVTGESDGIPVMRQLPGPKNSLGRVKFLFPNDFNIYFHDTPVKSLFAKDKRAYSHGCIRLQDPEKMAEYLLKDEQTWTPDKIKAAMNSTKEQHVELKHSVPVLITYYTAWVDDAGILNFRDDIYGHDSTIASKMFIPTR